MAVVWIIIINRVSLVGSTISTTDSSSQEAKTSTGLAMDIVMTGLHSTLQSAVTMEETVIEIQSLIILIVLLISQIRLEMDNIIAVCTILQSAVSMEEIVMTFMKNILTVMPVSQKGLVMDDVMIGMVCATLQSLVSMEPLDN